MHSFIGRDESDIFQLDSLIAKPYLQAYQKISKETKALGFLILDFQFLKSLRHLGKMFPKLATRLVGARKALSVALTRNIGSTSVVLSKLDPIQELYLQKVREYYKKKRYSCLANSAASLSA